MVVLVRSYRAKDAAAVVTFFYECSVADSTVSPIAAKDWLRFVTSEINRNGQDFLVATHGSRVIGLATSSARVEAQEITRHFRIIVLPDSRCGCVGGSLLMRLKELDPQYSYAAYQTICPSKWKAALRFYTQRGFLEYEQELQFERSVVPHTSSASASSHIELADRPSNFGEVVAEIHNLAFAGDASFVRWTGPAMSELLLQAAALWTAQISEQIIGYCHVEEGGGFDWIESVAVHPAFRRRGIGTALCTAVIRNSFASGKKIRLQVSNQNVAAVALYKELGFLPLSASIRLRATQDEIRAATRFKESK